MRSLKIVFAVMLIAVSLQFANAAATANKLPASIIYTMQPPPPPRPPLFRHPPRLRFSRHRRVVHHRVVRHRRGFHIGRLRLPPPPPRPRL